MLNLDLIYKSCENGFCRVYYTSKSKDGKHKLLYCMQQDYNDQMVRKYGYQQFNLYRCTLHGEPEYSIDMEQIRTIESPKGTESTEVSLLDFLHEWNEGRGQ